MQKDHPWRKLCGRRKDPKHAFDRVQISNGDLDVCLRIKTSVGIDGLALGENASHTVDRTACPEVSALAVSRDFVACVVKAMAALRKRSSALRLPMSLTRPAPFLLRNSVFTFPIYELLGPSHSRQW